ncbi:MAG: DUF4296 domain-containing protein [Bacteroidales bacterium]|nr:DUF4296 domain-containing protein [Bacteroidales bacterium]
MMKYKILVTIVLIAWMSYSCNQNSDIQTQTGKEIISADTLELMIFDIHLTDAIITSKIMKTKDNAAVDSLLYQSIYDKYSYSKDDFEQTLLFYAHNKLDSLNAIYDRVIERFNIRKGEIYN